MTEVEPRPRDRLEYERAFWGRGVGGVAGVDEAGRGPLAGPVVAAAVVLPPGVVIEGADDSKALTSSSREELYVEIRRRALSVGVGAASVREIDRDNILVSTTRAMNRALGHLPDPPGHVVVDGLPVRGLDREHEAVVGGDGRVHCVGCASIVAKVVRDHLMRRLANRYPVYDWHTNMGYGTVAHRAAILEHGVSPHHRLTFVGVQYELAF